MADYTKPTFTSIPFTFTSGGYTSPNFSSVPFEFGATVQSQTADLAAAIKVLQVGQKDLSASITGLVSEGYVDLPAYIAGINLSASVDFTASIAGVLRSSTSDLAGFLNVISIFDLSANITGVLHNSLSDLGASVDRIFQVGCADLAASTIMEYMMSDISASISMIQYKDLLATLTIYGTADLSAYLNPVLPVDLPASIHGFDTRDITASLIGGYGPYDLQASITAFYPADLQAVINVYGGMEVSTDLSASIENYHRYDLAAFLNAIPPVDLAASITGLADFANLSASIYPKVIHLKKVLLVSLLEYSDLRAVINSFCVSSQYSDLAASMTIGYKNDLSANIVGWGLDGSARNLKDLSAFINTSSYYVQDVISVYFIPAYTKSVNLKVKFSVIDTYNVFNTINVNFSTQYRKNLAASITGTLRYSDITASLTPVFDFPYNPLPHNVMPKTREIVIDLDRLEEDWRRVVEIFFHKDGDSPFVYFYSESEGRVYRVDRTKHWTIWAKSFIETTDDVVERRNIREKYVFKMSDFDSVDEAVRYLINRTTSYEATNLSGSLTALPKNYKDLSALIYPDVIYSWSRNLSASLNVSIFSNLNASITGV